MLLLFFSIGSLLCTAPANYLQTVAAGAGVDAFPLRPPDAILANIIIATTANRAKMNKVDVLTRNCRPRFQNLLAHFLFHPVSQRLQRYAPMLPDPGCTKTSVDSDRIKNQPDSFLIALQLCGLLKGYNALD